MAAGQFAPASDSVRASRCRTPRPPQAVGFKDLEKPGGATIDKGRAASAQRVAPARSAPPAARSRKSKQAYRAGQALQRHFVIGVALPLFKRPLRDDRVVFAALDVTFRRLGGVPTYVLTDNEKTVTSEHIAGIPARNPQLVEFAEHYSVTVHTCVPADPSVASAFVSAVVGSDQTTLVGSSWT